MPSSIFALVILLSLRSDDDRVAPFEAEVIHLIDCDRFVYVSGVTAVSAKLIVRSADKLPPPAKPGPVSTEVDELAFADSDVDRPLILD